MSTSKQLLRETVEGLSEHQAGLALSLVQHLLAASREHVFAENPEVIEPSPLGHFEPFEPLLGQGPSASELLLADRR